MKIATVKIKNFRGYGENKTVQDGYFKFDKLDEADFLILNGFNGFGKTSFFDAIEWCLTNSVKRLTYFENNIDDKRSLKSDSYLIFISKNNEERKAKVEITFDTGLKILRTTTSKSLQDQNYLSKTKLYANDKEFDVNASTIFDVNLTKLHKVNFLGQETILDILKKDKPSERNKSFLDLVDLSELNKIEEKANSRFNFQSKIEKIIEEEKALAIAKEKSDLLFAQNNWKTIDDYILGINTTKDKILSMRTNFKSDSSFQIIGDTFNEKEITRDNCFDFIEKVNLIPERILKKKNELAIQKKNRENYNSAISAITLYKKNEDVQFIQKIDITKELETQKVNETTTTNNEKESKVLEAINKVINDNVNLWSESYLLKTEDVIKNYPKAKLDYNLIEEKTYTFIKKLSKPEYARYINTNKFNANELFETVDFKKIDSVFNDFNKENDDLSQKLTAKMNSKNALSNLNKSYVGILGKVKTYISQSNDIKSCPVCLSTVFTNIDSLKLPSERNALSIKEQLVNIIDSQVSSGNLEVQKILDNITEFKFRRSLKVHKIR